jgi:hypothetical protein
MTSDLNKCHLKRVMRVRNLAFDNSPFICLATLISLNTPIGIHEV